MNTSNNTHHHHRPSIQARTLVSIFHAPRIALSSLQRSCPYDVDIRAFTSQMPHLTFLAPLYNTSTSVLGVSALICTVIAYTIAKMFGFGSLKNEFIVEGKVCARR